jgi:hypothetical protein
MFQPEELVFAVEDHVYTGAQLNPPNEVSHAAEVIARN